MKPTHRKKLQLSRDTLRILTRAEQARVAGGDPPGTFYGACDTSTGCESNSANGKICCCDSILLCNSKFVCSDVECIKLRGRLDPSRPRR